eukprot:TRINITY_DN226_c0_g1_i5.p1 TRINITY_DN226_c0_g1~~TRINITY_DN226_c0_g1_i5.p1  ORF type:complete len:142 (-),score=2.23 TRINITY_DN226_c0_g1_i5:80-505(-)
MNSWKSYLFFLTATIALESVQPERELYSGESTSRFEVSGALLTVLENPREGFIRTPGRTHNRLRSPRLEASSQVEQCRQGKSAKQIRNFGKRIGSEGWAQGSLQQYYAAYVGLQRSHGRREPTVGLRFGGVKDELALSLVR